MIVCNPYHCENKTCIIIYHYYDLLIGYWLKQEKLSTFDPKAQVDIETNLSKSRLAAKRAGYAKRLVG